MPSKCTQHSSSALSLREAQNFTPWKASGLLWATFSQNYGLLWSIVACVLLGYLAFQVHSAKRNMEPERGLWTTLLSFTELGAPKAAGKYAPDRGSNKTTWASLADLWASLADLLASFG